MINKTKKVHKIPALDVKKNGRNINIIADIALNIINLIFLEVNNSFKQNASENDVNNEK